MCKFLRTTITWLCFGTMLAAQGSGAEAQSATPSGGAPVEGHATIVGNPLDHIPAGARILTTFGERPDFSPDGIRLAFMGRAYGDAFEYNLKTGETRNLTAHAPNWGFQRVQYLHDGNFLLAGPRRNSGPSFLLRLAGIELWYMDNGAKGVLKPLGITAFEGVAVSRIRNRIAWSVLIPKPRSVVPAADTVSALMVGDIVVEDGQPRVVNVREIVRKKTSDCVLEPQDFYDSDQKLTSSCYRSEKKKMPNGSEEYQITESYVWSVDVGSGAMTQIPTTPGVYAEVEGIFPDGRQTLVECGSKVHPGLNLCLLDLTPTNPRYVKITNVTDFGPFRFSNPVVSPDGSQIAFQAGYAASEAGSGDGIILMPATR